MVVYLFSFLILLAVLLYDPPSVRKIQQNLNSEYNISLLTLKNNANAPFYFHTALELQNSEERLSYGLYPDHNKSIWFPSFLKRIIRFFRPFYIMPGRVYSPDILYEGFNGNNIKIKPGTIVYKETYPITEQEYIAIKNRISAQTEYYSYLGYYSDNCSSWVRRLLNEELGLNVSCKKYRFYIWGYRFGIPLFFCDFPNLCSEK